MALVFGLALMLAPGEFYRPTGIEMTPLIATLAQAHGATLMGMSVIIWLARDADVAGLRAVMAGGLVVQILSIGVVARTMTLGAGLQVAPALVIHGVLGICYGTCLARLRQPAATGPR